MNLDSGSTPLVLLCPAWKKWGTATTVKPGTVILHSRADDVVPFASSEELAGNSGLPASALIEIGTDHRLADPEPLKAMQAACEKGIRSVDHSRRSKPERPSDDDTTQPPPHRFPRPAVARLAPVARVPSRSSGWITDRDDRRLAQVAEEPGPRWRSRDLLRRLRPQGGRHLPHVVLLEAQEEHRPGREQGRHRLVQAGRRPRTQRQDRLGGRHQPPGRDQARRPLPDVVHRAGTGQVVDRVCHQRGRQVVESRERPSGPLGGKRPWGRRWR